MQWYLIILGSLDVIDCRFRIGLGIALYGIAYFLLHDTLVHQRTKLLNRSDNWYFRAVVSVHNDHHIGKKKIRVHSDVPLEILQTGKPEKP